MPGWPKVLVRALLLSPLFAPLAGQAQQLPPPVSVYLTGALLCHHTLDMGKLYDSIHKSLGPPVRQEQGAFWWKASHSLNGAATSTEVFLSDASLPYKFIGAVYTQAPPQLAKALQGARGEAGATFWKEAPSDTHSAWVSAPGAQILWKGETSKLVCAQASERWSYKLTPGFNRSLPK